MDIQRFNITAMKHYSDNKFKAITSITVTKGNNNKCEQVKPWS